MSGSCDRRVISWVLSPCYGNTRRVFLNVLVRCYDSARTFKVRACQFTDSYPVKNSGRVVGAGNDRHCTCNIVCVTIEIRVVLFSNSRYLIGVYNHLFGFTHPCLNASKLGYSFVKVSTIATGKELLHKDYQNVSSWEKEGDGCCEEGVQNYWQKEEKGKGGR
jgi:hypothetical protein